MPLLPMQAGKTLAQCAGWRLSNLEIQKILYLAHMFYMGRYEGEPLVYGTWEAWDYGPVLPDLYHKLKRYGARPVENSFYHTIIPDKESLEYQIIAEAADSFKDVKPGQLVASTHRKEGAWAKHYVPGARSIAIPNTDILEEYRGLDNGQ